MKRALLLSLTLSLLGDIAPGQSSSANNISFQGTLSGANGEPLANGIYNLTFRFWDDPAAGANPVSTNILVPNVPVTSGVASTAIPVDPTWFNGQTRYLGVRVANSDEMRPRLLVTAVPYAAHSLAAAGLAIEDGNLPAGALRGPDRTWLFGYTGASGAEDISIGSRDGVGSERTLTLAAGGLPRIRISENGFVGIGALRPDSHLHLHGVDVELRLTDLHDRPSGALRGNGGTWLFGYSGVPGYEDISIGSAEGLNTQRTITINAGGFPRLKIEAGGHIGIGTLNPMAALDINGTTRTTVLQITSDRNAKTNFHPVDLRVVLEKLATLPLTTWSYTNSPGVRHLGPMAQDFAATFGLGDSEKHIATVDADGAALAAIQGLNQKLGEELKERDVRIASMEDRLTRLEQMLRTAASTTP